MRERASIPPTARPVPLARCWDRLFLMRPLLLLPVWAAFLLGARSAGGWRYLHPRILPPAAEGRDLFAVSLVMAAIYVLNQMADVRVDAENGKLFLLASGLVSLRDAGVLVALLLTGAAAVASAGMGSEGRRLLALILTVGVLYSVPPARWKAKPVFDVLSNAASYGVLFFLLGWAAAGGELGWQALQRSLPYGSAAGALFLLSTLEDRRGDAACGLRTSAVVFGPTRVRAGTAGLVVLTPLLAVAVGETPALAWGLLSAPAYLLLLRRPRVERGFLVNQLAGRLLVLMALPGALVLAALAAFLYAGARVYYRRRFGVRYPRLELDAASVRG